MLVSFAWAAAGDEKLGCAGAQKSELQSTQFARIGWGPVVLQR